MIEADLCLKGGSVLLPEVGLTQVDLHVLQGRIVHITSTGSESRAGETVDLSGLTVLPGAIDAHIHLGHEMDISRPRDPADADSESSAAAAGGVTTFLSYVLCPGDFVKALPDLIQTVEQASRVDFGFHMILGGPDQLDQVVTCVEDLGIPTVKYFMNARGQEGARLGLPHMDDGLFFQLLERLHESGGMVCPHAESIEVAWVLRDRLLAEDPNGSGGLATWYANKPPFIEGEGVRRACYFGKITDTPVYNVHISSREALEIALVERAGSNPVFIETCLHYLLLDIGSSAGDRAKVNPPIRKKEDRDALWRAIADRVVDVVGTDHVHRPLPAKSGGIWKASPGFPGMETLLPGLLTEGKRRGVAIEDLSNLVSRNPARIMGLQQKGKIAIGADADFAVVDLKKKWRLNPNNVVSSAGYSVLEDYEFEAAITHSIVRGGFALRDGALQQEARGTGRFVRRRLDRLASVTR